MIPLPFSATATGTPYCSALCRVVRRLQYPIVKHILWMVPREEFGSACSSAVRWERKTSLIDARKPRGDCNTNKTN